MTGRRPLKVLIAHHRWWFPTAFSGADIANHEFACKLVKRGVEVRVQGVVPPDVKSRTDHVEYTIQGIPVCLVKSDFLKKLRSAINDFKPDVVLTSCPEPNCGQDEIRRMVEACSNNGLPVVLYVHDIEGTVPLFDNVKEKLARVVTNSNFMAGRINEIWGAECDVVYPVPDWELIDAGNSEGSFVTFFNPAPHKGLGIANALARERFPKRPFLFVEGFIDTESHGISLIRSGNLVHARSSPDIATIYVMTNLVIIPSQWDEPFGRVALEAMYNHIPVIASSVGGLKESVGDGGLLISDYSNVEAWVDAVERLDDQKERKRLVEAGKQHVKQYSLEVETDKLLEILEQVAG